MDEYVSLPREHPESYHSYMWNNFFKHIDVKYGARVCVSLFCCCSHRLVHANPLLCAREYHPAAV